MRLTMFVGCALLATRLFAVVGAAQESVPKTSADLSAVTNKVPAPTPLIEGPNDSNIVRLVSTILRRSHYLATKMPWNDELSSRFLDRYLDSLDNLRLYFTQGDLQEFEAFRSHLDELTADRGDSGPARVIFSRFRERLGQQYQYVLDLLKTNQWDFGSDDRFLFNRKTAARPRDLAEARGLWRDRLRYEYLQEKLGKEKPEEITKKLTRRYNQLNRTLNEYDQDDVLQFYLTALSRVYDPHSDYMGKSELENFSIGMKLSLYGIGAMLRSEDGICKIVQLTPGGPAERSQKLKPSDKIIAVAQGSAAPVDVMEMKLNKVVELIRGPKDTEVRLTIVPADAADSSQRKIISLVRDEIKLEEQAAKAKVIEMPVGEERTVRLGVIDLPSFYASFELAGHKPSSEQRSTTADCARLIRRLQQEHVTGIILDLRHNGGGSLPEAINLTGLFIKEGPVVQVKDNEGRVRVDEDVDSQIWYDGPLIVLTSRFSASASEILAGALQDYGRALIVGDSSTHGKGTVQSLLQLEPIMRGSGIRLTADPGALKITIQKFYRASGASTQLKGVIPDIVLDSVNNVLEVGESSLDNPLAWDTIDSAKFDRLNRVAPFLPELKRRSLARTATDRDFVYIRDEMERVKKQQAEKSVSLNENTRLREKKEADERIKLRKKDLVLRPEPTDKIFEIRLADLKNGEPLKLWVRTNDLPILNFTNRVGELLSVNRHTNYHGVAYFTNAQGRGLVLTQVTNGISSVTFGDATGDVLVFDWRIKESPKAYFNQLGTNAVVSRNGVRSEERVFQMTRVDSEIGELAAKARVEDLDDESVTDELVPGVDSALDEARRILLDLVTLSANGNASVRTAPTAARE